LRDELVALLEEPDAARGIIRLGELGADHAIHPHLRGDGEAAALFERALALRDELHVEVPAWRLGLAALARELTSEEVYDLLARVKVRRRDADHVARAVTVAPRIVDRLRSERLDAAEVFVLADAFAPDAPLLALAYEERPELRDYFSRLRDVRLEIGGADLVALGLRESPRVGEVLAELRRCVQVALHRTPAIEQGEDRQPRLRARPLARVRLRGTPSHHPGPARGEPHGRGDEVGRATRAGGRPRAPLPVHTGSHDDAPPR